MAHYLDRILNPQSLAIIGASNNPAKRGYRAMRTLMADRYSGEIIPVNPNESEILGYKCYPSLADVPGDIDLALVCTAAKTAPDVIESCGRKGVKGALLLATGFSEIDEAGRLLEERTVEIARRYKVRIIGPNTNGIFSARLGCNAIGWKDIPRGSFAMLSNSANVIGTLAAEMHFNGHAGVSTMLSVGNQADVLFHEYLECFGADADTQAIICYVEGFKKGPAFMKVACEVSRVKPIVMYAAGRTAEGKRAARSHSASIAGDYTVTSGVLRQAGVILVTQSDHLFPVAEALALFPPMRGRRVAVLSEGGGPITMAAEALAESGLILAPLSADTQAKIREIVPHASSVSNPVDVGGGTEPRVEYYGSISRYILEDPNIDALLLVGIFGGYTSRFGENVRDTENAICTSLGEFARTHGKPVMVQTRYGHAQTEALHVLRKSGVPFHRHIEVAVHCLAGAARYNEARTRLAAAPGPDPIKAQAAASGLIQIMTAQKRDPLEPEANFLLRSYGIAIPDQAVMGDERSATTISRRFRDVPLAVKVISKDIVHKSDVGGVKLNVKGENALRTAFEQISRSVRSHVPSAEIAGMLVTPMARRGTEVIVGVTRDAHYGPVIMFGLGGVFVEVIKDVVFRALPITPEDAHEMLDELHYKSVLDGVRGAEPANKSALADLLMRISNIATAHPEIAEIDLNPVIAHGDGYTIVDTRIILAAE